MVLPLKRRAAFTEVKAQDVNYRHAFHAGNFADVHKHWVLTILLERLRAKDKPFFVLDTHAGAGFYDLAREETERTGEAQDGIGRLLQSPGLPPSLQAFVDTVQSLNQGDVFRWYPGSPWLIATQLRKADRLAAIEAHPEQYLLLRDSLAEFRNARAYERDGYAALPSLVPPKERRGLTLIDPPYERGDDLDRVVTAVAHATARFATGTVAIWYPIKTHAMGDLLAEKLPEAGRGRLRCELWVRSPDRTDNGLTGSGMIILNPVWPMEETLRQDLPTLAKLLNQSDGAGSRVLAF